MFFQGDFADSELFSHHISSCRMATQVNGRLNIMILQTAAPSFLILNLPVTQTACETISADP